MSSLSTLTLLAAFLAAEPTGEVLFFTGDYCPHCKPMKPIVDRLRRAGHPIRTVDCTNGGNADSQRFGIEGLPSFVLVINGKSVGNVVSGQISEQELVGMCNRVPRAPQPIAGTADSRPSTPGNSNAESESRPSRPAASRGRKAPPAEPSVIEDSSTGLLAGLLQPRANRGLKSRPGAIRGESDASAAAELALPEQTGPLASSVRIRIAKKSRDGGDSRGSGTVIHSERFKTYILTCGHLFRGFDPEADSIDVDFYHSGDRQTVTGRVLYYNYENGQPDIGLIVVATDTVVPATSVVGRNFRYPAGTPVVAIGCSNGEVPTVRQGAVHPDNVRHSIKTTVVNEEGRSGGGLFTNDGRLFGVCSSREQGTNYGYFTDLKSIYYVLDRAGLSELYNPTSAASPNGAEVAATETIEPEPVAELDEAGGSRDSEAESRAEEEEKYVDAGIGSSSRSRFDSGSLAFPPEKAPTTGAARRRKGKAPSTATDSAELVCVIYSRTNPKSGARVLTINEAPPALLKSLEAAQAAQVRPTSLTRDAADAMARMVEESTTAVEESDKRSTDELDKPSSTPRRYRRTLPRRGVRAASAAGNGSR